MRYEWHPITVDEVKKRAWHERVAETSVKNSQFFVITQNGEPKELIGFQHLDWDSKLLGLRTGRVTEMVQLGDSHPSYETLTHHFEKQGYDYVTARRPLGEWPRLQSLEAAGFRIVDGMTTMTKRLEPAEYEATGARLTVTDDAMRVAAVALASFKGTRYHNDPILTNEQSQRIHWEWAKNSCLGINAKAVWIIEGGGQVQGFVACKVVGSSGIIDLIAVSPDAAGQGVGRRLVTQACHYATGQGCRDLTVQTQTDNYPAFRLYTRCGFEVVTASTTLRWASRDSKHSG